MKNTSFELFAVAAPGLEAVCAGELAALGAAGVHALPGGVEFSGGLETLYRANLHLRAASRVVVRVGAVRSRDFPDLFRKTLRLPWGRFVRPATRVSVRASSRRSRLQHTGRLAATIADAVGRALGRGEPPADGPEQLILARFEEDVCLLSVDSSGELLHRRGYREETAHAPLRETLAAGILLRLGWNGSSPLLDPMCGSGTLVIEGALLACNRAPGSGRHFAFMEWPRYRPGLWEVLLAEATRAERTLPSPIRGSDRDPLALASARRNAARAGVGELIELRRAELDRLPPVAGSGLVLCNPPYGERLGKNEDLRPLFRNLGEVCRRSFPDWRVAFLSPDDRLARATGLPLDRLAVLNNGGIEVSLWSTPP